VYVVAVGLLAVGVWLRLHDLGLPFDRDGYDEGVYWQSLRAMSAGHTLYQQIFYSQPPFFLLSTFPSYVLFGQTLWAARFGVVLLSLLGLLGAFLLGKALGGRISALAALLLLTIDPLYLTQSQRVQAEAPAAALSLLAVGLAYLWWEHPEGFAGLCYAVLGAITLSLSILSKLWPAALVPVGLLMLAQIWRIWRQPEIYRSNTRSLLAGIAAFILTTAVVLLPFVGSSQQMVQGVISFHLAAGAAFKSTQASNASIIRSTLVSFTTVAALIGTCAALLRRDWRVLPLIAWFFVTVYMLWQQTPLFPHHLVMLIPPLAALSVIGIGPIGVGLMRGGQFLRGRSPGDDSSSEGDRKGRPYYTRVSGGRQPYIINFSNVATIITVAAILIAVLMDARGSLSYLRGQHALGLADATRQDLQVAKDLQAVTRPDQLVITDAQFVADLAERSTPASLVDTSQVRIQSGYVTTAQLIQEAGQPQVHAVLFYTGRLSMQNVGEFHTWVTQHFRLAHDYGGGRELWLKV
ncbi:MAG: phospholipid carrier-dependent glycosyltransferase, partial [Chloroflexi bacterium]|nr:phospholipid carrier-dependent glycosyltransferase [Chloroflexota bacterium]